MKAALNFVRRLVAPWTWLTFAIDPLTLQALIGGGTALLGIGASNRAARAQQAGINNATAEQRRQFNWLMQLLQPQQQIGDQARNEIAVLLGLSPVAGAPAFNPLGGGTGGAAGIVGGGRDRPFLGMLEGTDAGGQVFDQEGNLVGAGESGAPRLDAAAILERFANTPGQQYQEQLQQQFIEGSAANRGGAFSGGVGIALNNQAAQSRAADFGNEINRLLALASGGQAASQTAAQVGGNTSTNISNLLVQGGATRAAGILGGANSIGNALNNFGSNYAFSQIFGGGGGGGAQFPGLNYSPVSPMSDDALLALLRGSG